MKIIFSILLLLIGHSIMAQDILPSGGGEHVFEKQDACLSPLQRANILKTLDINKKQLKKQGLLKSNSSLIVSFDWPLQKTAGLSFNNYYTISYFVDHNPAYTGSLQGNSNLDYYCGNRSYDTNGGYNHKGTDMATWPFPWYLYDNDFVEVIAAEAGTIVGKDDGNDDDHCSCFGDWNAIYIEHADGSTAWYGHLKTNSLTPKAIGQTVAKGEYLGLLASSGCSSDPHLHFEVYDPADNLIDPYAGPCNSMNTSSWWANQQNYREPTMNVILTHDAVPVHGCPGGNEEPNISDSFTSGQTIYFALYYRDQLNGDVTNIRIRRPDNSIYTNWNHTSPNTYDASWWYWYFDLPTNGPYGTWTFEADYKGETFTHNFDYLDDYCNYSGFNSWVGPTVGNWNENNNYWSRGMIPKDCDNVFIPNGYTVNLLANNTGRCNTILVQQGAVLNVVLGGILNVQNP